MGLLDTFQNSAMLHAAAVHAPVALSMLGVLLVLLSAVLGEKSTGIRWLTVAMYLGLVVAAFIAVKTGEQAREELPNEPGVIQEPVWNLVHDHENMAGKVWLFALATAVLTAFTGADSPNVRVGAGTLAVAAALGTAAWVALTAHYGGTLVYVHGLGTPALEYRQRLMAQGEELETEARAAPPPADPARGNMVTTISPVVPEPQDAGTVPQVLEREASYINEVVPILEEHCYGCHGRASGLNLQTIETMLVGGRKAGPAVIAGRPDISPLIRYVRGELQPRMPQDDDPLTTAQIEILRAWIAWGMQDDSPE